MRGLAYGSYTLAVTFMGYEKAEKEFRVTQPSENLGKIALREAAIAIETVVKEVQALRTSQKGDTVSYNANAFKVTADADVEGLLKKMPGIGDQVPAGRSGRTDRGLQQAERPGRVFGYGRRRKL